MFVYMNMFALLRCITATLLEFLGSQVAIVKVKGKAIPLQAWTDPEVSRRFRLPDFKTIAT
jgi:hypothetical protein